MRRWLTPRRKGFAHEWDSRAGDPETAAGRTGRADCRAGGDTARGAAAGARRHVGGQYKPLSDADVPRIHEAALQALEVIGLANAPASGVEILTGAGAVLGDDGRIRFPRALVEDMLAVAARNITLHGRDPAHDLTLSGTRVHFGTAGAAVHIVDPVTGDYREVDRPRSL